MQKTITLLILICSIHLSYGQTYASPELKAQEERNISEKNAKLGITNPPVAIEPVKKKEEKAPFDMNLIKNAYLLTTVEAVDFSSKHSRAELAEYTKQAQEGFDRKIIALTDSLSAFYFVEKNDNKQYKIENLVKENNTLRTTDCVKCQGNSYEIISLTDVGVQLELKPQDEGHYFTYILTLKKQ